MDSRQSGVVKKHMRTLTPLQALEHDIKGGLNALTALLDLISLVPADEAAGYIQEAQNTVKMLARLARRISRGGEHDSDAAGASLTELVEGAISFVRDPQNQYVEIDRSGVEPILWHGDSLLFIRALANLVKNSQEAIGYKSGKITISASRAAPLSKASGADDAQAMPAMLCVRVADTGPGIPPEILSRAGLESVSTKPAGTGIGLMVVRSFVNQSGGTMRIASTPEEGTVFELNIPESC